jgi:hypothetical protein
VATGKVGKVEVGGWEGKQDGNISSEIYGIRIVGRL